MTVFCRRRRLIAIVGPTATGKSTLGLALAERLDGEIVSCDSAAVYRGFDIGTDKVPARLRRGILHHLVDVTDSTDRYSAARYASEAAAVIRAVTDRGRLPILVGGTGLYYRALTRGLFPGPARNVALRARLTKIARWRGTLCLHQMVARVDPASARRIHARDEKRLVRALEVYFLTGRPLTDHFAETRSPMEEYRVMAFGLRLPVAETARRVAERVDRQFDRGLLKEVQYLLDRGVPEDAPPFGGLVYRQVLEHVKGVRDEKATRELIVRENQRYSRRQLLWFSKEPNLRWVHLPGEHPNALVSVARAVRADQDGSPAIASSWPFESGGSGSVP